MKTNNQELINTWIRNRRSVYPKDYIDKPVEDTVILDMLENANWAPTHRFTEPWRFLVFKGDGRKRFAEFQAERYRKTSGPDFREDKYRKMLQNPLKASHIISIGMKRHEDQVPEVEEIMAVASAVQNMQLTASVNGVGCYWSTGGVTFDNDAKSFFDLGPGDRLLGFLYVGHYEEIKSRGFRKPVKEKVKWIEA